MSNFDPRMPSGQLNAINTADVLMASSSISATTAIAVTNFNARGAYVFMNITSAFPGSGSTTLALKVKALAPGLVTASAASIAAVPAVSASGMTVLCVYPGAIAGSSSAVAGVTTVGRPIPRDFLVVASYSSAAASAALTVSIGIQPIL